MKFMKKSFEGMEPYFSKNITEGVILNANESPYNVPDKIKEEFEIRIKDVNYNRYPDMAAVDLCKAIANKFNVKENNVTVGVGSDELIETTFRATLEPNDILLSFSPSFSMYQVFAELSLAKFIPVDFKNNLFDVDLMIELINKYNPKLVLICTPNNPNGAFLEEKEIRRIAESSKGLVLLDLAYIDFAKCDYTYLGMEYDNIIAFRTFSKAMSLPSIRVGYAISNEDNINMINAIKPPYSVTSLSLIMAEIAIKNYDLYKDNISKIKAERERLIKEFKALGYNPLPSEANFIYLNIDKELDDLLIKNKIYIRKFKTGPARITVGSALENDELLRVVKLYEKSRN